MKKVEELMNMMKACELFHKENEEEKKNKVLICVFAVIGAIAIGAAIAYFVYRHLHPDYLEDMEDEFEDEFEDEDDESDEDEEELEEALEDEQ